MRNSKLLTLATLVAQCISIVGAAAIAVASPNTLKKVPLRVFIDVTAPEAAVAWSRLRRQAPRAKFQWLVHPLPLVANQNSHLSAAKVLY
ncbi:MAG TPA: hypothetical protein DCQ06_06655, partial [Myxococcales bacterium]|nr:hypothetical protein [Myxococcales bacterium]